MGAVLSAVWKAGLSLSAKGFRVALNTWVDVGVWNPF